MVIPAVPDALRFPLVPVTVNVLLPVGLLGLTEMVSVEVPDPVTVLGLKFVLTLLVRPLTLRVTVELNPAEAVTVTVYDTEHLRFAVSVAGDTETVNSPSGLQRLR